MKSPMSVPVKSNPWSLSARYANSPWTKSKSVEAYGLCAGRAKAAGFDAFYIHAVGGYLISQFMTPYFNDRDDEYGGNLENRMRFLLELIASCQKYAGKDFPLIVRMSIDEFMGDAGEALKNPN